MKQAFAIVRHDLFQQESVGIELRVTVKKIVHTQERAESEVARLNELNGDKALYFWQYTRIEE